MYKFSPFDFYILMIYFCLMRKLIFILLIGIFSCESTSTDDCQCSDMIDKRWWANLNRDISIDCLFIEDFILETDGTVTIIRLGNSFIEKVVKNAARYDLSDCRLTFSDHSEEYWLDTNPCGSHSSFTILDDDVYNIVNYQCSSFGAAVSYIDFEP